MGTRKGTSVATLQGRFSKIKPISSKHLDELLGIPDPVAEAEAERAAERAVARDRLFESITAGQPTPRARDLKAWAKNEQRVAEHEEAAQQQKWADVIGDTNSPTGPTAHPTGENQ